MSVKKSIEKKHKRETTKDDNLLLIKKPDEKLKKNIYSVSTSRNFLPKSSATDIYLNKNDTQTKTTKKTGTSNKRTPQIESLKSSSSLSLVSMRSAKPNIEVKKRQSLTRYADPKVPNISKNIGVTKKLSNANVTVNSPIAKRKFDSERDVSNKVDVLKEIVKTKEDITKKVVVPERKRTKTRTLEDGEIKILTPDVVDNNADMLNMTKKLSAQPKAFFIDLKDDNTKSHNETKENFSEEEVSYEDDFESYESDFESYHSESENEHRSIDKVDQNDHDHSYHGDDSEDSVNDYDDHSNNQNIYDDPDIKLENCVEEHSKEERMLDSGNFELRDSRSANKSKPLDYIVEDAEESCKKTSLTDEGFQEMSSSSGLSSMKTLHVDILERTLFIDFTKSQKNKRKQKIFERLKQRAEDILSMINLHEMTYNLFEMKPIPYDLYMATFGKLNYTQTAVQTFHDGVSEEVQTDDNQLNDKWTQYPSKFSKTHFDKSNIKIKRQDSIENFTFLFDDREDNEEFDDNYIHNPLRIYLDQKDGSGSDKIMPYKEFKSKLQSADYNEVKLRKFLKRNENRTCNILSKNSGVTNMTSLIKTSKFPFSNEYMIMPVKDKDKLFFLKDSQITGAVFSESKSNFLITIHKKCSDCSHKCVLCLWDLSSANSKPLKVLIATDNIRIGRFMGDAHGFLVGALEDRTIQLWDLSEEPSWCNDFVDYENSTKMLEIDSNINTEPNKAIKFNSRNGTNECQIPQSCAYTNSGMNICNDEISDSIVALEFMTHHNANLDDGGKILAQLCSLQSVGILTIWSILQEKSKNVTHDIGKAVWSKMKLEKNQTINLREGINVSVSESTHFNLTAVKRRIGKRKNERNIFKTSRLKSAFSGSSEPGVANRNILTVAENSSFGQNGAMYNNLKIMKINDVDNYLVAKTGGEVLCCRRNIGAIRINRLSVTNPASSVTCLEASPHGLPYFLAGTDCGTVSMCSLVDCRVLLTLDCRNCSSPVTDKCFADHKGRFLSSVTITSNDEQNTKDWLSVNTISWLHPNPFCITAIFNNTLLVWELTQSDIRAKCSSEAFTCITKDRNLALLTTEGDVQLYKLTDWRENHLDLFNKYVSLL